jgi:hypothetical protein
MELTEAVVMGAFARAFQLTPKDSDQIEKGKLTALENDWRNKFGQINVEAVQIMQEWMDKNPKKKPAGGAAGYP